jgi:VWFA-related protein
MNQLRLGVTLLGIALVLWPSGSPLVAQSASQQQQQQQEPSRIGVEVRLVNVVFSVLNQRNKFITDLNKENFRVFEDDKPQEITNFSRETDLPLRIGLLLDTSNSIRDRLKFEQEAAIDFLGNVVRRHKDLVFMMTFDNEPQLIHGFTDDVGTLTAAIQKLRAGGGTALYDTIYAAAAHHMPRAPLPAGPDPTVRRVLVVISDGEDNLSTRHTRNDAIEVAQRNDVVVYTISTSTDWMSISGETPRKMHKTEGDKVLEILAEETGGRSFFPYRIDDLAQSFLDISTELRSQYSLAYVPTNRLADGKFRKIRIETDRRRVTVRARKGYYAPKATAESRPGEN